MNRLGVIKSVHENKQKKVPLKLRLTNKWYSAFRQKSLCLKDQNMK